MELAVDENMPFLLAIKSGDPAAPLVYADWLDEQGRDQLAANWRDGYFSVIDGMDQASAWRYRRYEEARRWAAVTNEKLNLGRSIDVGSVISVHQYCAVFRVRLGNAGWLVSKGHYPQHVTGEPEYEAAFNGQRWRRLPRTPGFPFNCRCTTLDALIAERPEGNRDER